MATTSKLPQPSSGKHPFPNLFSLWRRGKKTKENSPVWMRIYRRFKLQELLKATNNFDPARKISEDASFSVYKGYIDDSSKYPVGIMRFNPSSDHQEFLTEMDILSNLHHPNIVSLIGYCLDGSHRIIVHTHMPHGTLRDHLHSKNNDKSPLSWKRRLQICIGVARGLECLHTGNPLIIHRDIKSGNILLDQNWVAKISTFQISKLVPSSLLESDDHVSTGVRGTLGYIDPEYMRLGQLTIKSDIYGFGVVLFESLCGRKPVDFNSHEGAVYLAPWARQCVEDGRLDEIIDPCLKGEIASECLKAYVDIAYNCLNERGNERPTTAAVVTRLQLALLLQECIEADVPFSPSWLRSIVPPPKRSESSVEIFEVQDSELSDDYDVEEILRD